MQSQPVCVVDYFIFMEVTAKFLLHHKAMFVDIRPSLAVITLTQERVVFWSERQHIPVQVNRSASFILVIVLGVPRPFFQPW